MTRAPMTRCTTTESISPDRVVGRVAKRILEARDEIEDGYVRGLLKQVVVELVLPIENAPDPEDVDTGDLVELVERRERGEADPRRHLEDARWMVNQARVAHQRELKALRLEIQILRNMLRRSVAAVPPQD